MARGKGVSGFKAQGVLSEDEYPVVRIVMEEDRCLNAAMVLERLSDNHLVLKGFLDSG